MKRILRESSMSSTNQQIRNKKMAATFFCDVKKGSWTSLTRTQGGSSRDGHLLDYIVYTTRYTWCFNGVLGTCWWKNLSAAPRGEHVWQYLGSFEQNKSSQLTIFLSVFFTSYSSTAGKHGCLLSKYICI
jgi:hypothetical protein